MDSHTVPYYGIGPNGAILGGPPVRARWAETRCRKCSMLINSDDEMLAHNHLVPLGDAGYQCKMCYQSFKTARHRCCIVRAKCYLGCVLPYTNTAKDMADHFETLHPVLGQWCECLDPQCNTSAAYDDHVERRPRATIPFEYGRISTFEVAKDPPHARLLHFHNAWIHPRKQREDDLYLNGVVRKCAALGMAVPEPAILYSPSTCFASDKTCITFKQHVCASLDYVVRTKNVIPEMRARATLSSLTATPDVETEAPASFSFLDFPDELILHIMATSDIMTVKALASTCRRLNDIYREVARLDRFRLGSFLYRRIRGMPGHLVMRESMVATFTRVEREAAASPIAFYTIHHISFLADTLLRHYTLNDVFAHWSF